MLPARAGIRAQHSGVFIRGGNWNNDTNAGAFTLNLNWDTGNTNNNVGFRCARYSSIRIYKFLGPNGMFTDIRSAPRRLLSLFLLVPAFAGRENTSPFPRAIALLWYSGAGSEGVSLMTLFERIADFENLHAAYRGARVCKRYRSSILKFGRKLEENLLTLRRELIYRIYKHGGYREFVVADSKKRAIKAAPFRDRVMHHAVCNVIEPILDRGFIYDSYACRKGKGTHAAVRRLESFLRRCGAVRERERE